MDVSIRKQVREPNALIGGRIRAGRELKQVSQEALGGALGISFQQVQKYENGLNRVSACTLLAIADTLGLEISYFFPKSNAAPVTRGEIDAVRAELMAAAAVATATSERLRALGERLNRAEADLG